MSTDGRNEFGSLDAHVIVGEFFPYDGPHSPEKVSQALDLVGLLLRYVNNATQYQHALPDAQDATLTLSKLTSALSHLPQLLEQTDRALSRHAEDGTLYDDQGEMSGQELLAEIRSHLPEVTPDFVEMMRHLGTAAERGYRLGGGVEHVEGVPTT